MKYNSFIRYRQLYRSGIIMIFVLQVLYSVSKAQPCQPPPPEPDNIYCPFASQITVGIFSDVGPTYTWFRDGQLKAGPRAGNGGAISYNFSVASQADAGHYYVVEQRPGFPDRCVFSKTAVYLGGISGLATTSITANSVSFSWTAIAANGSYEYEILEDGVSYVGGGSTNSNNVTVNYLSGGTNYDIRVVPLCGSGFSEATTISFTTLPGQCSAIISVPADLSANKPGNYCNGENVNIQYYGLTGQQYTLLKNGAAVSGIINGTNSTINFSFAFNGASSAGNYNIRISKPGCINALSPIFSVAEKTTVSNLTQEWVNEVQASFSWNSSDYSSYFILDTTLTASPPASPANVAYGKTKIVDVRPATTYYLHVKPGCFTGTTTAQWASIPFTTAAVTPVSCNPVALSICGAATTCSLEAGGGEWNLAGNYPLNSTGNSTAGKEKLYSFTPIETAVYYLDISSAQAQSEISYLYKPAASGCNNEGWIGIRSIVYTGKYAIGRLTAGTTYLLLLDNKNVTVAQQSFRICKAQVAAPSPNDQCITTSLITAISPFKEEFFLDQNGNLVASLDASSLSSTTYIDSISFYVNSNTIRRDFENREYLDRDFSIYGYFSPGLIVNLFFTGSELTRLINEPNDGLADVNTVADLQVSRMNVACSSGLAGNGGFTLIAQQSGGIYDNGFFVQIPLQENGTYFLHGGNAALNYVCQTNPGQSLSIEEGFNMPNSSLLPPCWSKINNLADISFINSSINPITSPFEGSKYIYFNSYLYPAGTYSILNAPQINTQGYNSVDVEFYWYNNNNPLYTSNIEGVQVEYSLNGINWTWVNFVQRHDDLLPVGTGQWKKKRMALPAATGNKDVVFVRFIFFSQYGDNCAMDALTITASASCNDAENITVTSLTSNAVNYTWSPVAGVSSYEYKVSTDFPMSSMGTGTAATSATATGLSPATNYYLYARPLCSAGNPGAWNSILIKTKAACRGENIAFFYNTQYFGPSYVYHWQVNTGSGFTDISNSSVYSGATTTGLLITNPPGTYSGYQYRCAVAFNFDPTNYYYFGNINTIQFINTWKGTISNAWNNAVNWSCNAVPDANTDILIPAGTAFQPEVNTNITCKSIKVEDGATVSVLTGNTITVTGK